MADAWSRCTSLRLGGQIKTTALCVMLMMGTVAAQIDATSLTLDRDSITLRSTIGMGTQDGVQVTLQNESDTRQRYVVLDLPEWLGVSSTNGVLRPGGYVMLEFQATPCVQPQSLRATVRIGNREDVHDIEVTRECERLPTIALPVFNQSGLDFAISRLLPAIQGTPIVVLVSGNVDRSLDLLWLQASVVQLQNEVPHARIFAATAGVGHLTQLAKGVPPSVEALVYIYEPDFPNVPEFRWDFSATMQAFTEATSVTNARGLKLYGKPTGRPLLQEDLAEYAWDYGALAQRVDGLFVQTQTYCTRDAGAFAIAVERLNEQVRNADSSIFIQLTTAPGAPNSVAAGLALECFRQTSGLGFEGVLVWWSPREQEAVALFLDGLGR